MRSSDLRAVAISAALICAPWLAAAQAADPKAADPVFEQQVGECRFLVIKRHLDRAKPRLKRLLAIRPNRADLWMLLGACDLQPSEDIERHHAEAKRCLNKALSIDPQNGEIYYYLADLESFGSNLAAAVVLAHEATTVKKPDKTAFRISAAANNALGKYKEALADIDAYIKYRPNASDGPQLKAAILEGAGDYSQADKVYKSMLSTQMVDKYVMADAKCLVKLGRCDEAIAAISRLLAVNSHDDVALRERAKLYKQSGKYNEAIKDLTVSIDEAPSVSSYKERADLYKKINRPDLCKKDLERANAE